jgi:hypothetical protein
MSKIRIDRIKSERGSHASLLSVVRSDGSHRIYEAGKFGYWEQRLFSLAFHDPEYRVAVRLVDPFTETRASDGRVVFRNRVAGARNGSGHIEVTFTRRDVVDMLIERVREVEWEMRSERDDLVEWAYLRRAVQIVAFDLASYDQVMNMLPILIEVPGLTENSYTPGPTTFIASVRCMLYSYLRDKLNVQEG